MTSVNVTTTKNTVTVNGETRVVTVKTQGPQGPAFADGTYGDIVVSGSGSALTVANNAITNAKIASNAAIDLTKLATGALPTAITVTSANISDLSIVNADINASAAISGTKINPSFGTQNIVTNGTLSVNNGLIAISGSSPTVKFTDNDQNPDYRIICNSGQLRFQDITAGNANRLLINSDGHIDIAGNLDVGAGVDITWRS